MNNIVHIDRELDVRGLNCPLPILRTWRMMDAISDGQVLKVTATDPAALKDFRAYARQTGHELLSASEADGIYVFLLRKK